MAELFEGFANFIQDRVAVQNRANIVVNNTTLAEGTPYSTGPTQVDPFTFYTKYYKVVEDGKVFYGYRTT